MICGSHGWDRCFHFILLKLEQPMFLLGKYCVVIIEMMESSRVIDDPFDVICDEPHLTSFMVRR